MNMMPNLMIEHQRKEDAQKERSRKAGQLFQHSFCDYHIRFELDIGCLITACRLITAPAFSQVNLAISALHAMTAFLS